jgi:anti-sigma regulatory factor (Ser/Thr protein kinase)
MTYRHEALLYCGADDFVSRALPFIQGAVGGGEPILVAVEKAKIERLRWALGSDADSVRFEDMRRLGANPALIIPAWRDFVDGHQGRRLRGIGEPIYAGQDPDQLAESQRHERLLNLAFGDAEDFRLLCPYDKVSLPAAVIAEAMHSHPKVSHDGIEGESASYLPADAQAAFDELPEPSRRPAVLLFDAENLAAVRTLAHRQAMVAKLPADRAVDLVLAVNEVATNSLRYGGGKGTFRAWSDAGGAVCEVSDSGYIADPLVDRRKPAEDDAAPRGLWFANQVCDLVQVRSKPGATTVRLRMNR